MWSCINESDFGLYALGEKERKFPPLRRSRSFTGFAPFCLNGAAEDGCCGPIATDDSSWGEEGSTRAATSVPSPPPSPDETAEETVEEMEDGEEPVVVWPDTDEDEPWLVWSARKRTPLRTPGAQHHKGNGELSLGQVMMASLRSLPQSSLSAASMMPPVAHRDRGDFAHQGQEVQRAGVPTFSSSAPMKYPPPASESTTASDGGLSMESSGSEADELKLTAVAMVEHPAEADDDDSQTTVRLCNLLGNASRQRLIKAINGLRFAGQYKLLGIGNHSSHELQGHCFAVLKFDSGVIAFKFQKAWNAKYAPEMSDFQASMSHRDILRATPSLPAARPPTKGKSSENRFRQAAKPAPANQAKAAARPMPPPPPKKGVAAPQSGGVQPPQLMQAMKTAALALQKTRAMMPPVNMQPSNMCP
eukprot:s3868_g13.t1